MFTYLCAECDSLIEDDGHRDCEHTYGEVYRVATPDRKPASAPPPPIDAPHWHETRREQWPDGSSMTLSFAVRVF